MKPEQTKKYKSFTTVELKDRQWPDQSLTKAPIWASVDLRDGNQALPTPMNIEEKLEYFDLLVDIGFKEIEVGFPSASDTEYNFLRKLIEEDRIPEDVTVQVLVQAREHLIRRISQPFTGLKKRSFIYTIPPLPCNDASPSAMPANKTSKTLPFRELDGSKRW